MNSLVKSLGLNNHMLPSRRCYAGAGETVVRRIFVGFAQAKLDLTVGYFCNQ